MNRPRCPVDFDLSSPEQRENPFPVFAAARDEQPVFWDGRLGLWVVTRYDDVKRVLTDWETFSSEGALRSAPRPFPPDVRRALDEGWPDMPIIIDSDPPVHRRLRSLINRAFTPRRVRSLEPTIRDFSHELIDEFTGAGEADIVEEFAWPLPLLTLGEMLDIPRSDLPHLHELSQHWLMLMQDAEPEARTEHARRYVELQHYFVDLVESRSTDPGDDLVSDLVASQQEIADEEGWTFTPAEVAGIPLDLMVAGHVTVTRVLGSALVRLSDHPEQQEQVREDPDRLADTIDEVLRLESPAQGLFRTVTRDVTLSGVEIPAGERLMVLFSSANRDQRVFEHAEEFDPDRDDRSNHLAFGHGIHFCVGHALARLELRVALEALLDRLPNLRVPPDGRWERDPVFFARGFDSLEITWDPVTSEAGSGP